MTRRTSAVVLALLLLLAGTIAAGPAQAAGSATPFGHLDRFRQVPGGIELAGWVVDPDTSAPVQVHVSVDGEVVRGIWADDTRSDIGARYPTLGADHGFTVVVPVTASPTTVCAYAINRPSGTNPNLGCTTFHQDPKGRLDGVVRRPGGSTSTVHVSGWAIDPDEHWGIPVHLYSDGRLVASTIANDLRSDVGAHYPAYGDRHGFSADLLLPPGRHHVCAFGIDRGAGRNALLGCRDVSVATLPVGVIDSISRTGGSIRVKGWTIDPDVTTPTTVEVRLDGALAGTLDANVLRSSLGLYGAIYGTAHGFDGTVPAPATTGLLACVYAVNVELGSGTRLLGCRTI